MWESGAPGGSLVSVFDVESSACNDFSLISEEERLVGPVKSEVHVNTFRLGLGGRWGESSTKSALGRVALTGKRQLRGIPFSDTACSAQV